MVIPTWPHWRTQFGIAPIIPDRKSKHGWRHGTLAIEDQECPWTSNPNINVYASKTPKSCASLSWLIRHPICMHIGLNICTHILPNVRCILGAPSGKAIWCYIKVPYMWWKLTTPMRIAYSIQYALHSCRLCRAHWNSDWQRNRPKMHAHLSSLCASHFHNWIITSNTYSKPRIPKGCCTGNGVSNKEQHALQQCAVNDAQDGSRS